jgi:hypothetical protein
MVEPIHDYWTMFAREAENSGSLLYARLARGIGGDDDLKAIAARARPGQPHANLILAAVHFLLLRGSDDPLRRFYRTAGGAADTGGEDPFPLFRNFCLAHRAAIETMVAARVTNTNEVGRSAVLHAGFRVAAAQAGEPLNLIEIGPSAGLNMIWDRYGVRYKVPNGETIEITPDASLVIDCELRGERRPPVETTPRTGRRVGLELNPVDLTNRDDRDWLRALVWPDQIGRLNRLDRAIGLFQTARPEIRTGDALALLPDALRAWPAPLCVYHTVVTYQFSQAMRTALDDLLTVAGLRRPVWRLAMESEALDGEWVNFLTLSRYSDGVRAETRLAKTHPHGTWMEWLA